MGKFKEWLKENGIDAIELEDHELVDWLREYKLEMCRDDVVYYVSNYCSYEDKDAESLVQRFEMWKEQEEALKSIHDNRLNIILKARQLGFSWLTISYASWVMRMRSGRTVIGLSRTEDEAMELVRRLGVEFRNQQFLTREKKSKEAVGWEGVTFEQYAMKLVLHFPNEPDSVFYAFPSAPGSVRSFTADLVIFDEWAFQQWASEIWKSASPTINRPTGGKFIGLSTNVHGSLFEETYINKDNGFNHIFIPWYADPRRDDKWYKETLAMLGEEAMHEEYPASEEEALSTVGGLYFPEISAETHITDEPLKGNLRRYVSIDYGFDMLAAYWYQIDENYNAQIYREYHIPNQNAMQAADAIRDMSNGEKIDLYLAPPDLWNRQSSTGKSTAIVFSEHGIELTKVDNSIFNGCMRMKEWLHTEDGKKAKLTILGNSAPNLFRCLKKILTDKNKPNQYAKTPHELTHSVDSLRYFSVYWTLPSEARLTSHQRKWTEDMYEDYNNANDEYKQILIEKWGEPK